MGRLVKDVCYRKRGNVWYYRPKGEANFTSTGLTAKAKAESYVNELLRNNGFQKVLNDVFENYAGMFFVWDSCPHATRLRCVFSSWEASEKVSILREPLEKPSK